MLLNHFKDVPEGRPELEPARKAVSACTGFEQCYIENRTAILTALGNYSWRSVKWGSRFPEEPLTRFESELDEQVPGLRPAAEKLENCLEQLKNWRVDWSVYIRGKTRYTAPALERDSMIIAGASVGLEPIIQTYDARLILNYERDASTGLHFPLASMLEVSFTPPEAENE